jgi:hypothetical protein
MSELQAPFKPCCLIERGDKWARITGVYACLSSSSCGGAFFKSEMFYFQSLKIVQRDIIIVFVVLILIILTFSSWVVPIFLLEWCWIIFRIYCLLFNFYLWYAGFITSNPLSKFHFVQFHPLFSSLGHSLFITLGPYTAIHGIALLCHIKGFMITALKPNLRMFLNKIYTFSCLNVEYCLSWC